MEILDGKSHTKSARRSQLEWIVWLLNEGKHWGWLDHASNPLNLKPEQLRRADEVFMKQFRALVEQWIESGKDSNGIEQPLTRNVRNVPSGYAEPLFGVLLAWLGRHTPKPVLMNSGKIAISLCSPSISELDENGRVRHLDPEHYAKECAIFHLKELLDLAGAHRLARCNNPKCGRYYLRRRLRKAEIKRGTYCGECSGAGSVARTRVSREGRAQKLVNLAVQVWDQWKPTHRYGKKSDWVAKQINKRSDAAITGKWVSQNRTAIEIEQERRKHAKG